MIRSGSRPESAAQARMVYQVLRLVWRKSRSLSRMFHTSGRVPLKRAATPEDVAGAVAFFCSPDADYITGQTLNVDGGIEMD